MERRQETAERNSLVLRAIESEWIAPGAFFAVLGLATLWLSRDYPLGTLNRMGPGYFPRMLGIGMVALGLLIAARGVRDLTDAKSLGLNINRSVLLIPAAMVVFGLSVERIGLVPALALALVIAAAAEQETRWKEAAVWIAGLITLLVVIFVFILGLPLRLWPEF